MAMAKHPAAMVRPLLAVEVAVAPVRFRYGTLRPEAIVEVAEPPTFRSPAIVVEPVLETAKRVVVAKLAVVEEIEKRWRVLVGVLEAKMLRSA